MSDSTLSRRQLLALAGVAALPAGCAETYPERGCCLARPPEIFPPTSAAPPDPIPGFQATRQRVWAYDEIHEHSIDATLHRPRDEAELRALLRAAHDHRRPVTIRAGGQSLGQQALGETIVMLDAPAFRHIGDVFEEGGDLLIKCGAAALWGDVARKLAEKGYVPRSVVTTGDATIGGTAAVDGLSRMSPVVGKEGDQIKRFRMIDGRGSAPVTYTRGKGGPDAAVFNAAIAGFGTVGVMTEVTLKVAEAIPGYRKRPDVMTTATRYMPGTYDWETLLQAIARNSDDFCAQYRVCHDPDAADTADARRRAVAPRGAPVKGQVMGYSAVAWFAGEGLALTALEHRYVHDKRGHRIPGGLYEEGSSLARFAERLSGYSSTLSQLVSTTGFPDGVYVDDLCGFLFNLGNSATPAKHDVRRGGSRLNFIQQTFVVPAPRRRGTTEYDVTRTRHFLYLVLARCREREVRPITIDLLHLKGDAAYLSANRDLTGFGVTVTFADHDELEWPFVRETFMALSHDLLGLGGRVHLVKNVEADVEDIRAMYRGGFRGFRKIKAELDPRGILTNRFYDRYFAGWHPR